MRRFRFRLERILEYRRRLEEAAYEDLQQAIRRRTELERSLEAHKKRWRLVAQARHPLEVEEWTLREQYLRALQEQIEQGQALLLMLQAEEEQARSAYLKARRARESLDRLRQRAYERYLADLEAEIQKMSDEQVLLANYRR